jgi:hypothetical protein
MKYLVLSSATKDPFKENHYRSISVGLLINKQLKNKISFLDDKKIVTQKVGVTCERCTISDCEVRQVPAIILERTRKNKQIEKVVNELMEQFS